MVSIWILGALLFFGCLMACLEIGYRIGKARNARQPDEASKAPNVLAGSVYTLLGLLLSFSFSLAVQMFDARRHLVLDEANAIGTAYLRIDLLAPADQAPLKAVFKKYTDTRIAFSDALIQDQNTKPFVDETSATQKQIWTMVMHAYQSDIKDSSRNQLTPAINQMFDLATSRTEATETHVPYVIFIMLGGISLATCLLAGRALALRPTRAWGHRVLFSAVLTAVMFVIVDLDDPRHGYIRIDQTDKVLQELRASMN